MVQVNVHEAKTQLSKLIQKAIDGDDVIIARGNRPVVKMVPLESVKKQRRLGTAKGRIKINVGFDEPLEDFREYMQ